MGEPHHIRVGMVVRDADGRTLGKVTRYSDWGIEFERNFLLTKLGEGTAPWGEVTDVRDGVVTLARSEKALLELARGEIPSTWRQVSLPFGATLPAAPGEATPAVPTITGAPACDVTPGEASATPPPDRQAVPESEARNVPGRDADDATREIEASDERYGDDRAPTRPGRTDAGSPAHT